MMQEIQKVSVHGGHSGEFCQHARDSLEEVILAYIAQGFSWVGITEHMAPPSDKYRYPDEIESGLTAEFLQQRFQRYFGYCRELAEKYRDRIEIFLAFEIEWYPGAQDFVSTMATKYMPDYLLGSVHHVKGIPFDFDRAHYQQAVDAAGGLDALYCQYFDSQYEMLKAVRPAVVGHFDLIRIFDADYKTRLNAPLVQAGVKRNLAFIKEQDLILDVNLRGFKKSGEQYPSRDILKQAIDMGIAVVPGDDSHCVADVGRYYDEGLAVLQELGANLNWRKPARRQ